jgi:hypothetical protein
MLPQKYLDRVYGRVERFAVFKGSLALIVFGYALVKAGFELWIAQAHPNFGCPLTIKY